MADTSTLDAREPPEVVRTFRLVGEFMFNWAYLENQINKSIHKLLGLKGLDRLIVTANMTARDKIHCVRTLVNFYWVGDPEWLQRFDKAMISAADLLQARNTVAHNMFVPHDSGGVEFVTIKAKGKFALPEVVWSEQDFWDKGREANRIAEETQSAVRHALVCRSTMDSSRRSMAMNPFALPPKIEPNALTGLFALGRQAPETPGSPLPNPETGAQTPPAPPPKRRERKKAEG